MPDFYLSAEQPCPYLPERQERKLFTPLSAGAKACHMLSALTQAGFRRSHEIAYRQACVGCQACIAVRVPVVRFTPSRTQSKLLRRGAALLVALEPPVPTAEAFALFQAYEQARHSESEMAQMTWAEFAAMLTVGNDSLELLTIRTATEVLLGMLLADRLDDGFSAIYSFFAPDMAAQSWGTLLVLQLIAQAQRESLPYVYLGYWVAASRKMAYKARFQPQEHFTAAGWQLADELSLTSGAG